MSEKDMHEDTDDMQAFDTAAYLSYVKRMMCVAIPPAAIVSYIFPLVCIIAFSLLIGSACIAAALYWKVTEKDETRAAHAKKLIKQYAPVAASLVVGCILGAGCARFIAYHAHIIYTRFSEDALHVF